MFNTSVTPVALTPVSPEGLILADFMTVQPNSIGFFAQGDDIEKEKFDIAIEMGNLCFAGRKLTPILKN